MKMPFFKRIIGAALRGFLIFFAFNLLSIISRAIFSANLFDEEMLSSRALGAWNAVFLFLIFESTVFAFHRHRRDAQTSFFEKLSNGSAGICKSTFSSVELYIEFLCIALLSLAVPLSFDAVGMAVFGEDFTVGQVMLISLPVLLALEILAHLSVRNAWRSDGAGAPAAAAKGKKDRSPVTKTVRGLVFTATVYGAASLVIPWFLPFFVTMANLGGGAMIFVYAGLAVVVAVAAFLLILYLRAVKKRKSFLRRLKRVCESQGWVLSDVRKPYASLLTQQKGVDFTLEAEGQVFACKLMGSLFSGSPMAFSDTGEGIRQDTLRLFRVNVFQLQTRLDYRMEDAPAESKKILIILPIPKQIYASVNGSPPRPADTGEALGAYTLYNVTGFFGALERGHLGKSHS